MSSSEDLLIIYDTEAEQWAFYLRSIFAGPLTEARICCYDVASVTGKREDHKQLTHYKCKLLILSQGILDNLCLARRLFLACVLRPANRVVMLLCGVESSAPLLDAVPVGEGFLQISSEQDAQEYLSAITEILQRAPSAPLVEVDATLVMARATELELPLEKKQSRGGPSSATTAIKVLPCRVPCKSPGEIFILLQDAKATPDMEVEFQHSELGTTVTVKPAIWNERTIQVKAPDFTAGVVDVTMRRGGTQIGAKAKLWYYTPMDDIALLLKKAADPVEFMFQAFQISSVDKLDEILTSSLTERLPAGGFQGLQSDDVHGMARHSEDFPTLLHFAAQHGLLGVASVLLRCPGAKQALHIASRHGATPLKLAQKHDHGQLCVLLQEALGGSSMGEDSSIYEMMGSSGHQNTNDDRGGEQENTQSMEEEEDPYAPFGGNDDEYDTILASNKTIMIANRPPAPTPRPETIPPKEDNTPFIAQVFQKKMSQGTPDMLYSLPSKQGGGRDSVPTTYDTFAFSQSSGLEELIELQEKVKKGTLTVDEALERFSDWQQVQRGLDDIQQEKLRQFRARIISNREDDDNIYDKINIIHHTPDSSRDCQHVEAPFYSKPLKGQQSTFLWRADKR